MEEKNSNRYLGELDELPRFRNHRVFQVTTTKHDLVIQNLSTWKPFHKKGIKHRDQVPIGAGEKFVFDEMKGPGKITNIWFTATPLSKDSMKRPLDLDNMTLGDYFRAVRGISRTIKYKKLPRLLNDVFVKIYFDDAKDPSVDAPLGKFFGSGFGEYKHFVSRYVGMTDGGYISQFRMPFKKNARVEIVNTSKYMACMAFYGAVTYVKYESEEEIANMGYFHAKYNAEYPTTEGKPYEILNITGGQGHFIGLVLNTINLKRKHGFRFLEGNTKFYVDDETEQSIEFTGTEDIFQGAWYYLNKNRGQAEFSAPYHGLTIKTGNKRGQIWHILFDRYFHCKTSQYRFFPEGIPFKKNIHITIHHGEFDEIPANYDSVAYYFFEKP